MCKYKKNGEEKQSQKFDCLLVSTDPCSYCKAVVQGDLGKIHAAMRKFKDQTCWMLSSVATDREGHIDSFEDLCEFGADVAHNGDNHLAAEFILQNSFAFKIRDKIDMLGLATDWCVHFSGYLQETLLFCTGCPIFQHLPWWLKAMAKLSTARAIRCDVFEEWWTMSAKRWLPAKHDVYAPVLGMNFNIRWWVVLRRGMKRSQCRHFLFSYTLESKLWKRSLQQFSCLKMFY